MTKIYQKTLPAGKNAGFTLIELLVVVLIIGILAAVALPKYEFAVEKSRSANAISVLRAIKDAEEVYYMANGEYTHDMDDLDIDVSLPEGFTLILMEGGMEKVQAHRESSSFNYDIVFGFDARSGSANGTEIGGVSYCAALSSSAISNRLCAGYGPMFWEGSGWKRYRIN